ncbi:hypothetical protein BDB01DRAFT_832177 [Pilobolus umbonatus]|nr:hypothetical protein BDB01DRAFT_832177 [Pilobolus umbonatus]
MTSQIWKQLKEEIHSKCVAYDYIDVADNTLAEFIVDLVRAEKTREEVNNELRTLVGNDYDSNLTLWIYARKEELEHPQPEIIQETEKMDITPKVIRPNRDNRIFTQAIGEVMNNDRHPVENKPTSHSLPQRNKSPRSRSRSRSPSRNTQRPSYRAEKSIKSRLGPQPSSDNTRERPSVFDRLGKVSKATEIKSTKNERCKYWPNCKNGDECTYYHPSTVCPDFPNCPKPANECMFIHPETHKPAAVISPSTSSLPVPCKYFPYCTNPTCPFYHPVIQPPYYAQSKMGYHNISSRVVYPCRDGDKCTRPNCHFLHPNDPNPMTEIICKYDGACTRPNCYYKHTKPTNQYQASSKNTRQFSVPEDEIVERIEVKESADIITQRPSNNENSDFHDMDKDVVMDTAV